MKRRRRRRRRNGKSGNRISRHCSVPGDPSGGSAASVSIVPHLCFVLYSSLSFFLCRSVGVVVCVYCPECPSNDAHARAHYIVQHNKRLAKSLRALAAIQRVQRTGRRRSFVRSFRRSFARRRSALCCKSCYRPVSLGRRVLLCKSAPTLSQRSAACVRESVRECASIYDAPICMRRCSKVRLHRTGCACLMDARRSRTRCLGSNPILRPVVGGWLAAAAPAPAFAYHI